MSRGATTRCWTSCNSAGTIVLPSLLPLQEWGPMAGMRATATGTLKPSLATAYVKKVENTFSFFLYIYLKALIGDSTAPHPYKTSVPMKTRKA